MVALLTGGGASAASTPSTLTIEAGRHAISGTLTSADERCTFTLIKAISRHHQRERQLAVDDTMTPFEDDDGWHAEYRIRLPHGFSGRVFARTRAFGPPPHCSQASSAIVRIGGARDRD